MMRRTEENTVEACALIARCLDGDAAASREFQEAYGELIYGYPLRVFRTPVDEAGDFYVFAFDGGRIYRRLRRFEGRAPLRAYLLGFVLDDLVLEWKRGERKVETVSMEDVGEMSGPSTANRSTTASGAANAAEVPLAALLDGLDTAKAVVFKLLHAEDCELTAAEVRHIAATTGKTVPAVLDSVDALRANIRDREAAARTVEENLDSVQAWIQLYERRVARIDADLADLPPRSTKAEKLREEKAELERKVGKRRLQRAKVAEQAKRRKTTAPYKEIAAVLATTVGNVGSQIARLRDELSRAAGADAFAGILGRDEERNEMRANNV